MPEGLLKIYNIFQQIKKIGMIIGGLTISVMIIIVSLDVISRNIFKVTIIYSYEFSQYWLMPLAVFASLAFTYGSGFMPRIDFLINKFNINLQKTAAIIVILFEFVLFGLLAYFGWKYAFDIVESGRAFTAGGKNYPLAYVIFFAPISFTLIFIEVVFVLLKNFMSENDKPTFVFLKE